KNFYTLNFNREFQIWLKKHSIVRNHTKTLVPSVTSTTVKQLLLLQLLKFLHLKDLHLCAISLLSTTLLKKKKEVLLSILLTLSTQQQKDTTLTWIVLVTPTM